MLILPLIWKVWDFLTPSLDFKGLKGLHLVNYNSRSLHAHRHDIRIYVEDSGIDCFTLSKTWLRDKLPDSQYQVPGYNILRIDHDTTQPESNSKGGGLLMYIAEDIACSSPLDIGYNDKDLELQYTLISKGNFKQIHLLNLYRPPDGDIDTFMEYLTCSLLKMTRDHDNELFIMGDFNIDFSVNSREHGKLEDLLSLLGLKQLITKITHINSVPGVKDTTLDLIMTNSNKVQDSGVITVNLTDHFPTYVTRKHKTVPKVPLTFTVRSYKDYVSDNFTTGLKNINLNPFWDTDNP